MGATLSFCNATNLILNLALSQVGPLYYENHVYPGQCWRQNTGAVHFTLSADVYTGQDNVYTDWSVAKPILVWSSIGIGSAVTLGGIGAAVGAGVASAAAAAGTAGSAATAAASSAASIMTVGSALSGATLVNTFSSGFLAASGGALGLGTTALGVGSTASGVALELIKSKNVQVIQEKLTTSSAGWYLGYDRTIYVAGGPPASHVNISGRKQNITIPDFEMDAIFITEDRPSGFAVKEYVNDNDNDR